MAETEALLRVELAPYDPSWPDRFEREAREIAELIGPDLVALEHIGSTAVPGLAAKPIIDMMAAARDQAAAGRAAQWLRGRAYELIATGMADRLFLRRRAPDGSVFQLHIVAAATWAGRHERLMRDYLRAHPDAAAAYGELKLRLARENAEDSLAYTRAKTDFVQAVVDKATEELGLCRIEVWPD
jgi:GrpB-like predicted nucleotidyltransferase (UPF0157 family)